MGDLSLKMFENPTLLGWFLWSVGYGIVFLFYLWICAFSQRVCTIFALFYSFIVFWYLLIIWINFDINVYGYQLGLVIPWFGKYNLNFSLGIDGLSLSFMLLTSFVMILCIFLVICTKKKPINYLLHLFLIQLFLLASFMTTNLFFFFVFFESVLIPMFLIIGIWGSRDRKMNAAYYFFLYTLFGSFFLMFGILYLYVIGASTEYVVLSNLNLNEIEQKILWICFFIPFAVKVPMFPFHIWLPEAHVEAPTIGSVVLASLLLKLGGYGFLRFTLPMFYVGTNYFFHVVYLLAIISIIYASLTAIRQNDLKKVIAYSSVAHMNLIVLGIFSGNAVAVQGSIYLMLAHGFTSGALFCCVGVLYDRFSTRTISHFSGLVQGMPLFSIFFFIFTLANMGFPGTANFVGELMIFIGLSDKNLFILILSATSIVFGAIYSIWIYNRIVFGTPKNLINLADVNRFEFITLSAFAAVVILFGFYTLPINELLTTATPSLLN